MNAEDKGHALYHRICTECGVDRLADSQIAKIAQYISEHPEELQLTPEAEALIRRRSAREPQVFHYQEQAVRVVEREDGPWWVLADVCRVLGLTNPTVVASRLDEDERAKFNLGWPKSDLGYKDAKGVSQTYTPGGPQQMTIISESGLYSVILRSDKPSAKPFKRWVTHEVLPSIRATGSYSVQEAVPVPAVSRPTSVEIRAETARLEASTAELEARMKAARMLIRLGKDQDADVKRKLEQAAGTLLAGGEGAL